MEDRGDTRAEDILRRARKLPPERREEFLLGACSGDPELLDRLRAALRSDAEPTVPSGSTDRTTTTATPTAASGLPSRIGPYHLLEMIGEGGMGTVFLAEQEHPVRRRVAIKIVKPGMDTREVVARFESERQALAMMSHSNIAKVLDAGATEQGRPYFVMEYVPGIPLTEYCDRNNLGTRERLDLFLPVCRAIHHAHQKGIIHRDVKPSNILVTIEDGKPVPKVIDFGIAKATSQRLTEQTVYTAHGRLLGTPEYMSPEQAEMGGLDVDSTTDIYSLGVVLYELLVGVLPFDPAVLRREGLLAIHRIIREVDPQAPSSRISTLGDKLTDVASHRHAKPHTLVKQVHGELDWITMRAIEKDRTRRYPSASELAADIERYLHGDPVLAGPPSPAYRLRKVLRRHRRFVASVAAVLVTLAIGLVVSVNLYIRADQARIREERQTRRAERINQFLQHMLASARPGDHGREVTVRQILDEAGTQVEADLATEPEVRAAVLGTIGATYMALGLYDDAQKHLESALRLRRETLGSLHADVASSLDDLASLDLATGDYQAAEPLFRQALAINTRISGEQSAVVATNLSNLAILCKAQARNAEAESLALRALSIRRATLGRDSQEYAVSLNNLASIVQATGRYAEAESLLTLSYDIQSRLLGQMHPDVAAVLNNLAAVHELQGEYAAAESRLMQVLSVQESLYGVEHPAVPETMSNLAVVLDYLGRYDEAEALYRQCLALYEKILGPRHVNVANAMNGLAVLLYNRGALEEAESLHRKTLALRTDIFGPASPAVASSMSNLAALLQDRGRLAEAERLYGEALGIQEAALGPEHPRVASTLLGLASVMADRGKVVAAEPLLERSLRLRIATYGADSWQVARARNVLGHCRAAQGRFAEAESLLLASTNVIVSSSAVAASQKKRALENVIDLYERWHQPARAAAYRNRLRELPAVSRGS